MARIMIVEDESIVGMNTEMILESMGHEVVAIVNNGPEALGFLDNHTPDLILMDIFLRGDMTGIDITRKVNASSDIPIVFMTACGDEDTLRNVSRTRHAGVLLKPFNTAQVQSIINDILERKN